MRLYSFLRFVLISLITKWQHLKKLAFKIINAFLLSYKQYYQNRLLIKALQQHFVLI